MLILGLLLVAAGALVVLTAVFSSEGTAAMLGNDLTALTIFLLGLGSGVAIMWGLWVLKYGTARSLRQRRERKQLEELSQKLDRVEAERAEDGDRDTGRE
jgi:hypothetical protein